MVVSTPTHQNPAVSYFGCLELYFLGGGEGELVGWLVGTCAFLVSWLQSVLFGNLALLWQSDKITKPSLLGP
jgi:hypothetical protein